MAADVMAHSFGRLPLYTAPPAERTPRQPEPIIDKSAAIRIATALGWTSPRDPWVGLTDEEVFDIWLNEMPAPDKVFYQKLCRSVEAKLKAKNSP